MNITQELYDELLTITGRARLDDKGREMFNPVPTNIIAPSERPLTLKQQIQRILRTTLSDQAESQGRETFEEANDFDMVDSFDNEPTSKYELMDDDLDFVPRETPQPPSEPEEKPEAQEAEPEPPVSD